MDDAPAVTAVIPTHNRRDLLLRTLDSVLMQRGVNVVVVVVDDGGNDGTADAVRALRAPNVQLIRHKASMGVSASRNAGIAAVETPWIAFVDDDDIWAPDKLQAQVKSIALSSEAKWSCVGAVHIDSTMSVLGMHEPPPSGDVSSRLIRGQVIPGGGSGVLVSTSLARKVGGFDEDISIIADWDFYLRLSLQSSVAAVKRPMVGYFVHSDSMYHDPIGLSAELDYLERKYTNWYDGTRLNIDYASWYFTLIRMAMKMGDGRAARRLVLRGMARSGRPRFARDVASRLWLKFRRMQVGTPPGWEDEAAGWLAHYAPEKVDTRTT